MNSAPDPACFYTCPEKQFLNSSAAESLYRARLNEFYRNHPYFPPMPGQRFQFHPSSFQDHVLVAQCYAASLEAYKDIVVHHSIDAEVVRREKELQERVITAQAACIFDELLARVSAVFPSEEVEAKVLDLTSYVYEISHCNFEKFIEAIRERTSIERSNELEVIHNLCHQLSYFDVELNHSRLVAIALQSLKSFDFGPFDTPLNADLAFCIESNHFPDEFCQQPFCLTPGLATDDDSGVFDSTEGRLDELYHRLKSHPLPISAEEALAHILQMLIANDHGGDSLWNFLGEEAFDLVAYISTNSRELQVEFRQRGLDLLTRHITVGTNLMPSNQDGEAQFRENRPERKRQLKLAQRIRRELDSGRISVSSAAYILKALGYTDEPVQLLSDSPTSEPPTLNFMCVDADGNPCKRHVLLKNTSQMVTQATTVFTIHPSEAPKPDLESLIKVTKLPSWAQPAFLNQSIEHLNPIQTAVYDQVFNRHENILVSAPTGAGKTNIALLAILSMFRKQSSSNEDQISVQFPRPQKVAYIAPMKSLVGEITQKFRTALKPYNLNVEEITADIQISRLQIQKTDVIVTVPEKYDIMTRRVPANDVSRASLLHQTSCLIIDEIHLLADDRGPIIEAIVARTLLHDELNHKLTRILGISATLPNVEDIAQFLNVSPKNTFNFGDRMRPVPLEQTFVGIHSQRVTDVPLEYDKICFAQAKRVVEEGHQLIIFVHSRGDTYATANSLIRMMQEETTRELFTYVTTIPSSCRKPFVSQLKRSREQLLGTFVDCAIGIHHAGMIRKDRDLVQKMFESGCIRILVSTATLAWGVNLPARCVLIKGTSLYDPKIGRQKDISILDVLQIFGRAGRPQYDDLGEAVLVTDVSKLQIYFRALTYQSSIDSKLLEQLRDILNAEIALGTISNVAEGVNWLGKTYLYTRLFKVPGYMGITQHQIASDPELYRFRELLITKTTDALNTARLIRINRSTSSYHSTNLGRIAAKYYLGCQTAFGFQEALEQTFEDQHILHHLARAEEFANLQPRKEEMEELARLRKEAYITADMEDEDKVEILTQAYIKRAFIRTNSLISDLNYIQQNSTRLMRAFFEIALSAQKKPHLSSFTVIRLLEWCKTLERRLWFNAHVLEHFCHPKIFSERGEAASNDYKGILKESCVMSLKRKGFDYLRLMDLSLEEITYLIRIPQEAKLIYTYLRRVPYLKIDVRLQPLTRTVLKIHLTLTPEFDWAVNTHGNSEPFWIWVEKTNNETILYSEELHLKRINGNEPYFVSFVIPLLYDEEDPGIYLIHLVSDRWVGVHYQEGFTVRNLFLPDEQQVHTKLLNAHPISTAALKIPEFINLYPFKYFNPIQSQVYHALFHTDHNILLGAPTGAGKTIVAELAMLRLFQNEPRRLVVYIAPLKALSKERIEDWQCRLGHMKNVVELTGDFTPDIEALQSADVVVTTPEKWDGISRNWRKRNYVQRVGLIIIDEIHLLGLDRGPILEVIVSRMRYVSCHIDSPIRFIGLSTALANAKDIAEWLDVPAKGFFNFKPSVRPVPCTCHILGFNERHYCPRMTMMNKPAFQDILEYSPKKPVLIFVSSRRQTRLTALDLIKISNAHFHGSKPYLHAADLGAFERSLDAVDDDTLRHTLSFGIGIHHAGLKENDRKLSEKYFLEGSIQVLVATATLAWGVNLPAHLVIIKGTEIFDSETGKYRDMPVVDLLQMIGRAGRPQYDTSAVACIYVQDTKKDFYKKFLYEPFPVESCLGHSLEDHVNAEIYSQTIATHQDIVEYLSWTYLFQRLKNNPTYYDVIPLTSLSGGLLGYSEQTHGSRLQLVASYLNSLAARAIRKLESSQCVVQKLVTPEESDEEIMRLECTRLGQIASLYYITTETAQYFYKSMKENQQMTWVEALYLLCSAREYNQVPVRHNEDLENQNLSHLCPFLPEYPMNAPYSKTFIMLQCHIFDVSFSILDYHTDLKSVLDQSIRLLQAATQIAQYANSIRCALSCIILMQCLAQGTHPFYHPLNLHLSAPCCETSLPSIAFLLHQPPQQQQQLLTNLLQSYRPSDIRSVMKNLRQLPVLEAHCKLQAVIHRDKTNVVKPIDYDTSRKGYALHQKMKALNINIHLNYCNLPPKTAFSPRYYKKKTYGWWVLLCDENNDALIDLKPVNRVVSALTESKSAHKSTKIHFEVPYNQVSNATSKLTLMILSDTYLGLDQRINLNFYND